MNFKKTTCLSLYACLLMNIAQSQAPSDSVRARQDHLMTQAALRYPSLRLAMVQTEFIGNNHYRSQLRGEDFVKGEYRYTSRIRAMLSTPVYTFKRQNISVTINYFRQRIESISAVNALPQVKLPENMLDKTNLGISLNYIRTDSVFGRPLVSGASLIGNTYHLSSIEKVSYLFFGSVAVKRTPTTIVTVGMMLLFDPSSPLPFLPVFTYWHKFRSRWELDVDLPRRLMIRRPVSRGLLSLGTTLGGTMLFTRLDVPGLPGDAEYRDIEIRTGAVFEYPVHRKVLVGISSGMLNVLNPKVVERNKKLNTYFISGKSDPMPYINLSISVLPFRNRK